MFKSNTIKTTIWLMLAVIASLAFTLAGCSRDETAPAASVVPAASVAPASTSPTLTAQDIADNAINAMSKLSSVQFSLDMQAKISGMTDNQAQEANITAIGEGSGDVAAHKMQANLKTDIETSNQTKMSSPMVYYMVDGWQYVQVSTPFSGTQWMKIKVDPGAYAAGDQYASAMAMMKSAIKVNLKGTEEVEGVSCYVLEVSPDLNLISEWLKSFPQTAGTQSEAMANIDLSKFVKTLSMKEYINVESYLLKRCEVSASIAVNGADLNSPEHAGENMALDMVLHLSMNQYNQPVTITLPPEAENARDMTPVKK
jgi:hypothetical protein